MKRPQAPLVRVESSRRVSVTSNIHSPSLDTASKPVCDDFLASKPGIPNGLTLPPIDREALQREGVASLRPAWK